MCQLRRTMLRQERFGGQAEEGMKMRRHAEKAGHGFLAQNAASLLGIEARHDFCVPAEKHRGQRENHPRAMTHGRDGQKTIVG